MNIFSADLATISMPDIEEFLAIGSPESHRVVEAAEPPV